MRISDWSSDVCSSDLVGHIAASTLTKADQHPALFSDHPHRQPCTIAIAESGPMQRWQYPARAYLADMGQSVFQYTLLDGHLRSRVQVLPGAPSAYPELRPGRRDTGSEAHKSELKSIMRI